MFLEVKKFLQFIFKSKLLILGFVIYFLFNLSALTNHFLDFFFFGSSIHHCCQGLDFYQIPNGLFAFIHGGSLSGELPEGIIQYSGNYVTNFNVYHPLLTIILGSFFVIFDPEYSIRIWVFIKIIITVFACYYIYKNFIGNKYLSFALFVFLINFSSYNEIKISQYQFLFNISLLFLIVNLINNKNGFEGGIIYFISLISKPVSLLFAPVLLLKRKWNVLIYGLGFFLISTLAFKILNAGDYFINNIIYHLFNPVSTKGIDFMSLDALLRNGFSVSENVVKILKMSSLILIYAFSIGKNVNILKSIFLLTVYFLFFYDLVFQYHFSVLGPVLALSILVLPEFQSKISKLLILIISLPSIYFIFRIFNYGIINNPTLGIDPTIFTWRLVSLFQILPIIILTVIVMIPDIKVYLKILSKYGKR